MDTFKKNLLNRAKKETFRGDKIEEIPLKRLIINPYQPRIEIRAEEIKDLANSIKENGLLQPILVNKTLDGYMIIAGHRRVEAHKYLGKAFIRAIVLVNQQNKELAKKAIVENLQRENLDLIETAMAFKKYKEEFDKTDEEIAKEIGKSRSTVTQVLNVLNLPEEIINDVKKNKSTKDVLALNMLNSYFKKLIKNVNMLTKSKNPQEIGAESELEKGKNEIIELYQGFLKYGRGWLKEEIDRRLKSFNKKEKLDIKVEFGKRKTKIELNISLNQDEIKEIEAFIKKFANKLKVDKIDIKENKYLKQQKNNKKQ